MKQKTLFLISAMILIAVGVLLFVNSLHLIPPVTNIEMRIPPSRINRIEFQWMGKTEHVPYVEQETFAYAINQAEPIDKEIYLNLDPIEIPRITITLYADQPIVLTPMGIKDKRLVFQQPSWSQDKFFIEKSPPKILPIIEGVIQSTQKDATLPLN